MHITCKHEVFQSDCQVSRYVCDLENGKQDVGILADFKMSCADCGTQFAFEVAHIYNNGLDLRCEIIEPTPEPT